ncbi:hypothetical protein [Hoeflea alexandrii]|uniref:Uncharacterized protein n=1 Tax=Hoeflea alexandrii TaxID=288436 RepID=A0ABT1CMA8_9HYPH|nr:hypothetical protein [Hoeflea alexandrii]MCO6407343.1 hypothetical protein [Hoeflea alexandrii]MCY0154260.1 hypothetical protein [Hoeflea alexandrii]
MKIANTMIAWNSGGDIECGPWPDKTRWSREFRFTAGACDSDFKNRPEAEITAMVFILFNTVVVRDGISVEAAHRAFLKIDEYRDAIAPDLPGT